MSETSCQSGARYIDKEMSLHEEEQAVEGYVPF
jgi:hypothetical protein